MMLCEGVVNKWRHDLRERDDWGICEDNIEVLLLLSVTIVEGDIKNCIMSVIEFPKLSKYFK